MNRQKENELIVKTISERIINKSNNIDITTFQLDTISMILLDISKSLAIIANIENN
jgi:hypothetical protein